MSVAQILSQSSNVGTITLAQLLGKERLLSWLDRFGFGRGTGVDYPGESRGLLPSYWSGSTIGNVPIGHGIAVTPVQMAAAYGAIANGGVLKTPHLVERIGSDSTKRGTGRRVVSQTVAAQVMTMLRDVVTGDGGTGAAAAVPGYTVAGKTGTAAKPERGGKRRARKDARPNEIVADLRMPPHVRHGGSSSPARTRASARSIGARSPQARHVTSRAVPWISTTRDGEEPAF